MKKKFLLSIVSPTFNEEKNIEEFYLRVKKVISKIKKYQFEFILIDNNSQDQTVNKLKKLAKKDPSLKIIVNLRNFGHIRSPYYGILQSSGLATIYLASDLQDPPEIIPEFIKFWEQGFKIVLGVKPKSKTSIIVHLVRKFYYRFLNLISEVKIVHDSTGFGLYDKKIINYLKFLNEPYPFLRGIISELGYKIKEISFVQPKRQQGNSKNNFFTLYDIAMLGIVNHSKIPLRICSFLGFILGFFSFLGGICFLIFKIIYWNSFPIGIAPIIISIFFLIGMILLFIGVLGEYIISIHTYVKKRPLVIEKERINF
jgi:glycosyltransferase involved in cell wall biosynthesis